jgi:uncharacterized protein
MKTRMTIGANEIPSRHPEGDAVFSPLCGNEFRFDCHRGIACFTKCCAKLRLILTPYDIVRLKRSLGLSSEVFLDQYTITDLTSHNRFPMVMLKMTEDADKTCPYVSSQGCRVYEDRPAACRLYPVGKAFHMAGANNKSGDGDKFFLVQEPHCLGFREKRPWSLEQWLDHEGLIQYNEMNRKWLEIVGSNKSLGPKETLQKKIQMFFMASYNLDRFREFIFKSRFFEVFELGCDLKENLNYDDSALLELAFYWLKFSLFGDKTMRLKSPSD